MTCRRVLILMLEQLTMFLAKPILTVLCQDDKWKEPSLRLYHDTGMFKLGIYGNKHKHQLLGFVIVTGIFPCFLGIVDPYSHPLSHRNLHICKKPTVVKWLLWYLLLINAHPNCKLKMRWKSIISFQQKCPSQNLSF